jgi:hypothetical protein
MKELAEYCLFRQLAENQRKLQHRIESIDPYDWARD